MTKQETKEEFAKSMNKQNFEDWLKTVNLRNGGVHLVSGKGYGKSTSLKHISTFYAKQPETYVIVCDTILNFALNFDKCPFYTVKENDVTETSSEVEINDGKSYLVWAKEYKINPEPFRFLEAMLKRKEHLILFDISLQEIDLVGVFQAKLIDFLYQKQRIKKKYWKGKIPEQYVLISEETEAVFDNTFDRKILNRTRKQYSEMANLRIAMFSCSQRLQEISTKFRGKMDSYLIGHTSIEDFDLKLCRMLKYSKHRKDILELPKGIFLDSKSDTLIEFPDFKPNGVPYEIKFKITEQPQQPQKKNILQKIVFGINSVLFPSANLPQRATARNFSNTESEKSEFDRLDNQERENESEDLEEIEEEFPENW